MIMTIASWMRMRALARCIGVKPSEISQGYDETSFRVNLHRVRDGTSPEEARRLVTQLRKALEIAIGPETQQWTCDTMLRAHTDARYLKSNLETTQQKIENELFQLPRITPTYTLRVRGQEHAMDYHVLIMGFRDFEKRGWTIYKEGEQRHVTPFDKLAPNFRAKVAPAFATLKRLQEQHDATRQKLELLPTYHNIAAKFTLHPETAEMLKIGTHDVLNTLYATVPDGDEYAHTHYDGPQAHTLTLREAFDGKPIQDRTTPRDADDGEYMVLTDDEADDAWDQDMDNYLEECVLPELDKNMRKYFNREQWKKDAAQDGRGHSLGRYDGEERSWGDFYIYRTN